MDDEHNSVFNVIQQINKYKPIFLCLCLPGNSLSVYVLFGTKLRYNLSSIYLGILAISDIGVLVTIFIYWMSEREIINLEYWSFILTVGMQMSFCFLSVWIVVAFTVQRYIAIKWPLLSHSLCTVNRTKIILIGLTLLGVLYSIPWSIVHVYAMFEKIPTKNEIIMLFCWRVLLHIHAIVTFVLPATITVMFNILITYIIRKQNQIRENLILITAISNDKTLNSDNETSHIKTTKMIVIILSIFIFLNAPIQVCIFCVSYNVHIKIYC